MGKVLKRDRPPASVVLGYALLLASTPMTSATEIFSMAGPRALGSLGWSDQVSFTVFFVLGMAALALFPAASTALLHRGRRVARRSGIKHLVNEAEADMPRATYVTIFTFGFALGCTWAVFFSIRGADLALWASTAFLALGVFMLVGVMTFMPKRDLEFGGAMRWVAFLSIAGFLLLPLIASVSPVLMAFLMALAWSGQVLLLSFLPVEIAVKLPVRMLSVAGRGGVAYGVGIVAGSVLAAAVLFALPLERAYSAVMAVACLCLVGAALRFPPLDTEASRMGMKLATRDAQHASRVLDQSKSLAVRRKLTQREEEIASLLLQGMTRQQIASELNISEQTVKTHVKHVYEKLDVHSLRELALLAEKAAL